MILFLTITACIGVLWMLYTLWFEMVGETLDKAGLTLLGILALDIFISNYWRHRGRI